jgi:hypothetical protein
MSQFKVDLAEPDNQQDAAAPLRFGDWINARLKTAADQLIGASGNGQVLKLGIGQVDHLDDKVAGGDLLEVFLGDADRD